MSEKAWDRLIYAFFVVALAWIALATAMLGSAFVTGFIKGVLHG